MTDYLHTALSKFQEIYKPVSDITKSTHLFSTAEIYQALNNLNPGAGVDKNQIFDLMEEAGYIYLPDPDKMSFTLKWMVLKTS